MKEQTQKIKEIIGSLQDESGKPKTREDALVITKLQEAILWLESEELLN